MRFGYSVGGGGSVYSYENCLVTPKAKKATSRCKEITQMIFLNIIVVNSVVNKVLFLNDTDVWLPG